MASPPGSGTRKRVRVVSSNESSPESKKIPKMATPSKRIWAEVVSRIPEPIALQGPQPRSYVYGELKSWRPCYSDDEPGKFASLVL